ncbi:hypothetical protein RAC89_09245 [Paenibacillus sp. GD4]|uniref:hypothetical protein n=1 Tax=Paenibacillus sp. GD4 TaxID=3068890 RepID=UPI0027967F4D|nr:hypothetical protein [Paenibacillus sp. GD4]MDQ1910659.1 hypothetical protein [Paenibacillus sp. GD4]
MLHQKIVTPEERMALLGLNPDSIAKEADLSALNRPEEEPELRQEVRRLQRTVLDLLERMAALEQQLAQMEAAPARVAPINEFEAQSVRPVPNGELPISRMERFGRRKSQPGKWFR